MVSLRRLPPAPLRPIWRDCGSRPGRTPADHISTVAPRDVRMVARSATQSMPRDYGYDEETVARAERDVVCLTPWFG